MSLLTAWPKFPDALVTPQRKSSSRMIVAAAPSSTGNRPRTALSRRSSSIMNADAWAVPKEEHLPPCSRSCFVGGTHTPQNKNRERAAANSRCTCLQRCWLLLTLAASFRSAARCCRLRARLLHCQPIVDLHPNGQRCRRQGHPPRRHAVGGACRRTRSSERVSRRP